MPDAFDFTGKIVGVWAKDPAVGGVLENVRVQELGNRFFIGGRAVDTGVGDKSRVGVIFWFAVDEVYMLTEFASLQKAIEVHAKHYRPARQDRPWWKFWG